MMSYGFLLVSLAYVLSAVVVGLFELRRTRLNGIDVISLFVALFMLQCCFSAATIYGLLPFLDPQNPTNVYAFDKILSQLDVPTAWLVFVLSAGFLLFFYVGCSLGRAALAHFASPSSEVLLISVNRGRILAVLGVGLALTMYSFMLLDDTMVGRYINLILLRSNDPQVERTALNANAFSLTQTWSWLSIVAIFCVVESRWRRLLLPPLLIVAVLFAVMGVSRRALFLPLLMAFLIVVLYRNRWNLRWIAMAALPLIVWVAFGKNLIASLAYDVSFETVAGTYHSWQSAVTRASSDVGITVVESVGTVGMIDIPPRLGEDHVLSMMRIFPERTLGFEVDYPERIVRISTTLLDDPDAADLPPGLMGQMWLDFRLAGPILWGIAFGLQMSIVQWLFERTRCTRQSSAIFVVLAFIVALPLNTGSFDFTFSVDTIGISVALIMCIKVGRARLVGVRQIEPKVQPGIAR